ncbi:MAG: hypothetical protein P8X97_05720 [Candidatus Bathyarchaeota archaeon]
MKLKWILSKKGAFALWYLGLWGVCSWVFFEYFYPHQNYGVPGLFYLLALISSIILLGATGYPLYLYFKRKKLHQNTIILFTVIFLLATIFLAINLAPLVSVSAKNKARVQWYINDLESQGFNVKYSSIYPYGHWHVDYIYSYSNFTAVAKELCFETIYVHAGVPSFFQFFVPPYIDIVGTGKGYYMYSID